MSSWWPSWRRPSSCKEIEQAGGDYRELFEELESLSDEEVRALLAEEQDAILAMRILLTANAILRAAARRRHAQQSDLAGPYGRRRTCLPHRGGRLPAKALNCAFTRPSR